MFQSQPFAGNAIVTPAPLIPKSEQKLHFKVGCLNFVHVQFSCLPHLCGRIQRHSKYICPMGQCLLMDYTHGRVGEIL